MRHSYAFCELRASMTRTLLWKIALVVRFWFGEGLADKSGPPPHPSSHAALPKDHIVAGEQITVAGSAGDACAGLSVSFGASQTQHHEVAD